MAATLTYPQGKLARQNQKAPPDEEITQEARN